VKADHIPYSEALKRIESAKTELEGCKFFLLSAENEIKRISDKIINLNRNLVVLKKTTTIASMYAFRLTQHELGHAQSKLIEIKNRKCQMEIRKSTLESAIAKMEEELPAHEFKLLRMRRE
jgi:hypothetical protein